MENADLGMLAAFAKYGLLPGAALYAMQLIYSKFLSTRTETVESGANNSLVAGLVARVASLESRQQQVEHDFETERQLRLAAESKVSQLTTRVSQLEYQLHQAGLTPA